MRFIQSFKSFVNEKKEEKDFEDKIKGHGYFKGISTSTARKKASQMKDQAKMSDDDPDAYKELPGDTKGKKLLKPSKHTKNYQELYGDEENESKITLSKKDMEKLHSNGKVKVDDYEIEFLDETQSIVNWELYQKIKGNGSINYETRIHRNLNEKAGGDRSPIDSEEIEKALKKKSEETGVPLPLLRIVMRRGMAAWKSGHRPGAGQEQWGYARVNSFLTKAPGTWGRPINDPKAKTGDAAGADADVAQEVIKGGHDKNLKEA